MDTEQGDTIYTEATVNKTVLLRFGFTSERDEIVLTIDEAAQLAKNLWRATHEAAGYRPR
jgi:hypothetical protein